MKTRLADIARATGFSINTVSRVLRGDTHISESTSKIIKEKAQELNYIPDIVASSMRSPLSKTVGVIIADPSNPFFSEVIKGIETKANQLGFQILLSSSDESWEKEKECLQMFLARKVDGIISTPVIENESDQIEYYSKLPIPFIFPGRYIPTLESHSLLHSDYEGEKEVVASLISQGHKKIIYLSGPEGISNSLDRERGYIDAFKEAGLECDSAYIYKTNGRIEEGYSAINRAIQKLPEFTAIACFNDLLAMGAMKSLEENNLKIPQDVAVFGFDNLYLSQFMFPSLSTVDVPKYQLGYRAMEKLYKQITEEEQCEKEELPVRLVYRQTCTH